MKARAEVETQRICNVATTPPDEEMRAWIEAAISASGTDEDELEVAVRIVDEQESRMLNHRFRRKDQPTNVLAFPADEAGIPGSRPGAPRHLGDLVICGPVVEREAREQGKDPAAHWGHLLVHGTLHLLGYDHQAEAEAARMERLEAQILATCGVADPYA